MMSAPEWTKQKKNKLIDLYRQAPVLWARKGQHHPRQRSNALQQIADEIGVNVLEVEKKLHVLRSQFRRERKRILNSQLNGDEEIYQSHWQYYKKLEFLACLEPSASYILHMGLKANPNTSEGESSNQSASKGETVDGTDDISSEDIPTQLYVHNNQKHLGEAPTVLPDDISSRPFPREKQSFQNPDDLSFAIRHDETDVVQDETPNRVDFHTGGIDDTLVSFGNYLVSLLRRLPLDKSYQLQQKFISETMNTTIQFEKERTLLLQKKRKNEVNQIHDRSENPYQALPEFLSVCLSVGNALSEIVCCRGTRDTTEISIEEGPQINHIKKELETSFEAVYCNGLPSFHSTVAEGVSGGLEVHSEDNRVMCVQCDVCKELFRTSAELRRHQAAKHPDEKNESLNREVASKRLRLEDRALTSPMSSTFITPDRPNSSASDRSH